MLRPLHTVRITDIQHHKYYTKWTRVFTEQDTIPVHARVHVCVRVCARVCVCGCVCWSTGLLALGWTTGSGSDQYQPVICHIFWACKFITFLAWIFSWPVDCTQKTMLKVLCMCGLKHGSQTFHNLGREGGCGSQTDQNHNTQLSYEEI